MLAWQYEERETAEHVAQLEARVKAKVQAAIDRAKASVATKSEPTPNIDTSKDEL